MILNVMKVLFFQNYINLPKKLESKQLLTYIYTHYVNTKMFK